VTAFPTFYEIIIFDLIILSAFSAGSAVNGFSGGKN
jgi:hypothetical protein